MPLISAKMGLVCWELWVFNTLTWNSTPVPVSVDTVQVCEIPSLGTTALKDTQQGDDGTREPSPEINKLNSQHLHVHDQSAKPKPTLACGSEPLRSHLLPHDCFSGAGISFLCLSAPGNLGLGQRRERVR